MLRSLFVIAFVCAWLCAVPTAASDGQTPGIDAVYPNPVAADDAGEYVVLTVPEETNPGQYALSDGETSVDVPAVTSNGSVTFSTAPNQTADLLDRDVRPLRGRLALSNSGERLELVRDNQTVDAVTYSDAPEGEVLRVGDGDREWRHVGATDRPVVTAGEGAVQAFVLPDAAGEPTAALADATDRILLAGYTLTSRRTAAVLRSAHHRNVTVRVLVEGSPVGGVSARQAALLDRLAQAGVDVRVLGGEMASYRYHHAKYAVVDDRALVTTENWKPAGTGGHSSRGWGVVTNQSRIVTGLATTFATDASGRDAIDWEQYRRGLNTTESEAATRTYPARVEPETLPVERTRLLVAPENAASEVTAAIARADESLWIEQASVGGIGQPFVRASVDAARRGVSVRLLLGNSWYNREENRAVVERLDAIATREDLDLAARLVEPRGRFETIHAKGAVIDGEHVLLGSLNWNNNSARNNREVVLALTGEAVGSYYASVVRTDWRGGRWRVTVGVLLVVLLAIGCALGVARRIGFEPVRRR